MNSKSVLCPIDFSPASLAALRLAVKEAELRNATLDLLHVWQPGLEYTDGSPPIPFAAEFPRERIESDLASLSIDLPPERIRTHATAGDTRHDIVETAKQLGSELVVMGTHAHSGLSHWIIGSVCEDVLRTCPCPVLICRGPEKSD
jgi:nucleotide-binding universal stress UspA family protein